MSDSSTKPSNQVFNDYHTYAPFLKQHPHHENYKVKLVEERFGHVPNFIGGLLPRRDKGNREDYCLTMLTFFKPWRSGLELKEADISWSDTFDSHNFTDRQKQLMDFFHLRYECRDARDDYSSQRKQ
ncbi:hypothetical protein BC629DRAFT_1296487, partial [Irpex lacteus]